MKLLFVCTGNTCRSAMAKEIAKKVLAEKGISGEVSSAGIYAFMGSAASEGAIKVMEEIDMDISGHVATMLDEKILLENDIILVMTSEHKEAILSQCPKVKGKVYTLGEYIGIGEDIVDPFGGDLDIYRSCRDQLVEFTYKFSNIIMNK